ncbi:hypothetical protein [Paenibacillus ehimensis]|uniref:Uncharacterized protein n=1 Tax=Paenibacillus ehimensis TaxID=79264 RepID=A0ABT8V7I1_9BACL|nr:hypothetical protein [Paenibacillus ehimensis]MDO3676683.1 hypothetical protein [Paenibacillus ehimensis]MEC0209843.1 hypothetical protein [Paenibacillus ehimensis]
MRPFAVKTVIMAVLAIALAIPGQAMAAHTPPPPEVVTTMTPFDPNYKYLENGSAYISYIGKGKASVWGETIATRRVDHVGVQLVLQRWTGSEWIDEYTGEKAEMSNSSRSNNTIDNLPVSSGYYYRVKSAHWITYGSTKEDGIRYSSTLLIPD